VKIQRSDGKIQRIETSSGQWVVFGYGNGVINSVSDSAGRTVTYNHEFVPFKGAFRGLGATTDGSTSQNAATESAAIAAGLIPIPPRRLTSAVTPEGTYAYTYEDDPPDLRLGALSFDSGVGGAISAEPPTCQNVRGGTRLKTIQLAGIPGVFTNYYGPSKRVLRQTWPDGTDIRFSYKVVGGCVPGLISSTSQPTEGAPISGGSNTTTCSGAGCIRIDSWEGDAITGGTIVGVEITDSRGKKFGQDFNTLGLATKVLDENGQELKIVRDGHRIMQMTDALGRTTSYSYDARGNRTKIVDPAGRETNISYDPKWNKPTLISRRLNETTVIEYRYTYDESTGVLRTSTDPENNVTTYDYNINRRLSLIRDPLQHQTAIEYDGRGNPSKITDALGNALEMITDSAGRIIQTTDALGNDTRASYNALNRLTKITDARQGETHFNFDGRNNLASVVNPLNHAIESYGYNSIGRLSSKTDAHLRSETYGYDGNGNLTLVLDRRNQSTGITYNARNQPERITYHDGTAQERTYDAAGRLSEIREGDNGQRMEYDILDRLTRVVTDTLAGITSITYEYDALDRRTKRTVSYPGGVLEETVYTYDKASRLISITQTGMNGTQTTIYEWDAASRLTQKTLPNGIRQIHAYDDANRLLSITYKRTDDSVMEEVSYSYDGNGQRTVKTSSNANLQDTTFSAGYDAANRMTSITLTATGKTYSLTYDDHGNLAQKQNAAVPGEITLYSWDARNRLSGISMTEGGVTSAAAFKYDALGRRIERTISQGASFQRTQYVYDGIQAIGELVDGRLAATILTGLNIDEVIARTVNLAGGVNPVATKSYLTDALGSVLATTLQNQSPELFYSYSAYGETSQVGADPDGPANSNQYTARENDGLVGGTGGGALYYYRLRYYDPVLKIFVTEDPIGIRGGANVYAYVGGNPISLVDPDGLLGNYPGQGTYVPGQGPVPFTQAIGLGPNFNKSECVQNYLKDNYGSFVANTLVPGFSALSYVPGSGTAGAAWTSAVISGGSKAVLVGGTYAVGQTAIAISAAGAGVGVGGSIGLATTGTVLVGVSTFAAAGFAILTAATLPFATAANIMALANCYCD
jgi:RHS repeat-associated protein